MAKALANGSERHTFREELRAVAVTQGMETDARKATLSGQRAGGGNRVGLQIIAVNGCKNQV